MSRVTITGNAWDHNQAPVPANLQPELWFRPIATSLAHGLLTNREVKAALQSSGAFTVQLESHTHIRYVPVLRWLSDPSQAGEDIENRAYGYNEWRIIHPGRGGDISELDPDIGLSAILYGFGAPPSHLEGVVYLDITGPAIRIYGPSGAYVED